MFILFLMITVAFYTAFSIIDARKIKRLIDAPITESVRVKLYKNTIIISWIPVVAVLIMCLVASVSIEDIGLEKIEFDYSVWFTGTVFVLCGGLLLVLLYQMLCFIVSEKYRNEAAKKVLSDSSKTLYDKVIFNLMIPRSKLEKGLFFFLSITAGITEEVVLRGFLFFLLQSIFPGISIVLVIALASIFFGFCHLYQGIKGVIKTSMVGALLGCLFIATGSLIPGIVLHFITDFSSAFILSEEKDV